jgi:RNase P/RNase MRP subunit POP5
MLKPLKPSMKENKRYLFVEGKNLRENIEKSILEFIGILGMSKTGLSFIKTEKDSAVICINREAVDSVKASFAVFRERIEVKKVSGTLKGLRNGKTK